MTRSLSPLIHKGRPASAAALDSLAGEILTFLAAEPERMQRFFDITGLSVTTLRRAAAAPGFAASLFDYVAADEKCLLAFAMYSGRDPGALSALRQATEAPAADDC